MMLGVCQVAAALLLPLTHAILVGRNSPNATFPPTPEKMFKCKSVNKGCPQLSHVWGRITATDPETNEQMSFKDVMAGFVGGKGYVKEWDWGHHNPRTHHVAGPGPKEFGELAWDLYGILGAKMLRSVYLSTGVNGALHMSTSTCSDVMNNFHPTEAYMENYHSQARFFEQEVAAEVNDTEEDQRPGKRGKAPEPTVTHCYAAFGKKVVEFEGDQVRQVNYQADVSECNQMCDQTPGCKSFAACPGDGNACYLKTKALTGGERTRAVGRGCETHYQTECQTPAAAGGAASTKAVRKRKKQGVFKSAKCVTGRSESIVKKWNKAVHQYKDVAVLLHSTC